MITRRAAKDVRMALGRQAAVALIGPRQVGKTTLARQIADVDNNVYLDLEKSTDRDRLAEPWLFLERYADRLVIIDEVHRAPELFRELRGLIDEGRRAGRRTGRFLILGSASMDLLRQSSESLAGRIEYVALHPFDVLEAAPDDEALRRLWVRGGFPESFLAGNDAGSLAYRLNFIATYLERDMPQFSPHPVPATTLERLWRMLAHGQGSLLNASALAASLSISAPMVTRYVDLMTDLLLVRRLPPFIANTRKRLVKSPKVYVRDSGLVHGLLGIQDELTLTGHPVMGASWEGFVIENLLAVAPWRTLPSFYRTAAGAEIDLVLELPGRAAPWAIEIKHSLAPRPTRGFHHALEDVRPEKAFVVYAGTERYPLTREVEVVGVRQMAEVLRGV